MTRPTDDPESSRILALSAGRDTEDGTLAILGTADALLALATTLDLGPGASLRLIPFGSDRPMLQPLTRLGDRASPGSP